MCRERPLSPPQSPIKSTDQVRKEFLQKLVGQRVWEPPEERSPKHQSVIIFDWDDTLMYTTFLREMERCPNLSTTRQYQLDRIEQAVEKLLNTAVGLGRTLIITNATEGWVEECVELYMPSLTEVMKKVHVISARSAHEAEFPGMNQWKKRAFLEVGKQFSKEAVTSLVSIGDSHFEMDAVHLLGKEFLHKLVKTVKMQDHPSPEELMKQLDLILMKLPHIVQKGVSLKIHLERKPNC